MKGFFIILCLGGFILVGRGQSAYQPSPENLIARKWFDSARFGMFIYWGAFSIPGSGEWVMNNRNITDSA